MSDLQARLVLAYREQSTHYVRAIQLLETASEHSDAWLAELQAAFDQIAAIDATLSNDKTAWRRSGQKPDAALREVIDELAAQVRRLSALVDARIAAIASRKQQLMPELDGFIRRNRMLQAYDRAAT